MAGWLSDNSSLGTGLGVMGAFLLTLSLVTLLMFLKHRRRKNDLLPTKE
jgi:hypothetical protein